MSNDLDKKYRYQLREREDHARSTTTYYSAHSIDISYSGELLFKDYRGRIVKAINRGLWKEVEEVIG